MKMAAKFSGVTNKMQEYIFNILILENSKTLLSFFSKGFGLYCKHNAKLDSYFVFIRLSKPNLLSFSLNV